MGPAKLAWRAGTVVMVSATIACPYDFIAFSPWLVLCSHSLDLRRPSLKAAFPAMDHIPHGRPIHQEGPLQRGQIISRNGIREVDLVA
jgi:hypothetical protein